MNLIARTLIPATLLLGAAAAQAGVLNIDYPAGYGPDTSQTSTRTRAEVQAEARQVQRTSAPFLFLDNQTGYVVNPDYKAPSRDRADVRREIGRPSVPSVSYGPA